ncbi:MAG: EAL domain-containing protein, partial [Methylobacterium sp.]
EVETSDGACAVLLVDLDRFKPVNDTLGHAIGDALLAKVAERLSATLRPCDTVARIGGDEFVVVQRGVTDLEETRVLARRIVDLIGRTYMIEGQLLTIGASVGVAVAPRDGTDADRLLKCADLALYRAKLEGRGAFRFFEAEMDARMQARRRLELDIRQALGRREFSLHYQPQLNLENDRVTGCEALLRWTHPERGMVPPGEFISLAEEIGLIVPIGEWVIRQACRDAATWPSAINVAVNVSPAQFKGDRLVEVIVSALASSGLAASRLEIEITEGVLLQENERTLRTLHRLRALGIRVSMDDFGTGYSSLSYLRSFPFDKIKIDRSFVADITQKPDGDAVIRAIAGLGRSLGMTTVAEGVETEDQMRRIRAEGCTDVQGYLVSRPIPAEALLALFNDLGPHGLAQA